MPLERITALETRAQQTAEEAFLPHDAMQLTFTEAELAIIRQQRQYLQNAEGYERASLGASNPNNAQTLRDFAAREYENAGITVHDRDGDGKTSVAELEEAYRAFERSITDAEQDGLDTVDVADRLLQLHQQRSGNGPGR